MHHWGPTWQGVSRIRGRSKMTSGPWRVCWRFCMYLVIKAAKCWLRGVQGLEGFLSYFLVLSWRQFWTHLWPGEQIYLRFLINLVLHNTQQVTSCFRFDSSTFRSFCFLLLLPKKIWRIFVHTPIMFYKEHAIRDASQISGKIKGQRLVFPKKIGNNWIVLAALMVNVKFTFVLILSLTLISFFPEFWLVNPLWKGIFYPSIMITFSFCVTWILFSSFYKGQIYSFSAEK